MDRQHAIDLLSARSDEIRRRFGVRELALFGSVARDEAGADSDVDVLVQFEAVPDYDRYMDLMFYLQDLLHARVDLVTREAVRPRMRPLIEREAVRVA